MMATSQSTSTCPECKGRGWVLYSSSEGTEDIYGCPVEVDYAKPCPACKGFTKATLDLTGVPDCYREVDIYKFDWDVYGMDTSPIKKVAFSFVNEFEKWETAGEGIYLCSKTPGSGKTMLACCMAKSAMMRTNKRMKFVTATDYINAVGNYYEARKASPGCLDESQKYRECDILVLDDIGAQKTGEWQDQELFRLINERIVKGRITIYTSNLPQEKLNVDERTISRIMKSAMQIRMPEVSVRKEMANQRHSEFIKNL